MSEQIIIRTGNSAAVTIPAEFMDSLGLEVGDKVIAELDYDKGQITYKFPSGRQLKLAKR
jgi:antitoxin component of MazEF toxin-antitoxin module